MSALPIIPKQNSVSVGLFTHWKIKRVSILVGIGHGNSWGLCPLFLFSVQSEIYGTLARYLALGDPVFVDSKLKHRVELDHFDPLRARQDVGREGNRDPRFMGRATKYRNGIRLDQLFPPHSLGIHGPERGDFPSPSSL